MTELWKRGILAAAGFASGWLTHHVAAKVQGDNIHRESPEGLNTGILTSTGGLIAGSILDNDKVSSFVGPYGLGISLHDVWYHWKHKIPFQPVNIMGQTALTDRWVKWVHIDDNLPQAEKEKILLPLIRDLCVQSVIPHAPLVLPQYELPLEVQKGQVLACDWLGDILKIQPGIPEEMEKVQKWIHREGVRKGGYQAAEGMHDGVGDKNIDRFRLLSILLRVWLDTGVVRFDCDDNLLAVGSMGTHFSVPVYAGVISQKEDRGLHHIFPMVKMSDGELWILEGIREVPPVPVSEIGKLFVPLTRFVLVYPSGAFREMPIQQAKKDRPSGTIEG